MFFPCQTLTILNPASSAASHAKNTFTNYLKVVNISPKYAFAARTRSARFSFADGEVEKQLIQA